ncbi:unnamed protein product [Symbiodinium sp. CCMP2592]|nr:unnamed protein product [Symbiodinium sp. CCMP2592]
MGKKWPDAEWQAWRSSSTSQYGGWHQQKGKGKTKDASKNCYPGPKETTADTRKVSFPSFDMMPAASGASSRAPERAREQMEIDEEAITTGQLARGVQKLLNSLRKSEGRSRKIEEERRALQAQWATFKQELQQTFVKEKNRFRERMEQLSQDLQEAEQTQEEALAGLQLAIAEPQSMVKQRVEVPDNTAALEELDQLLKSPEQRPKPGLADLLSEVLNGGGDQEAQRRQLLSALAGRRNGEASLHTPPRRTHGREPRTPQDPKTSAPTEAKPATTGDLYSFDGAASKGTPFPTSPSTTSAAPIPEGISRTRSRPGARIPVKQLGRGPSKPRVSGTALAQKLEAKRKEGMEVETLMDSDEDQAIGDLETEPEDNTSGLVG